MTSFQDAPDEAIEADEAKEVRSIKGQVRTWLIDDKMTK